MPFRAETDPCLDAGTAPGTGPRVLPHRGPLPTETVRDLLGIVRALYRANVEAGPRGDAQRVELEAIGRLLKSALALARQNPDSRAMGHRAAWSKAEAATKCLIALVDDYVPLRPGLEATARKIVG
jgi:hypothetical protein